MKIKTQFNKLSLGELTTKAADLHRQIIKLKLEKFVGKNRNVRQAFILGKQYAMVKTYITYEQRSAK